MIKIIKAGTKKKINCEECGSFLSYEEEDIVTTLDINANATKHIICPVCKCRIFLIKPKRY